MIMTYPQDTIGGRNIGCHCKIIVVFIRAITLHVKLLFCQSHQENLGQTDLTGWPPPSHWRAHIGPGLQHSSAASKYTKTITNMPKYKHTIHEYIHHTETKSPKPLIISYFEAPSLFSNWRKISRRCEASIW